MVYNKYLKQYIILVEGEHYCNLCKGKGKLQIDRVQYSFNRKYQQLICHKCLGTGVLDWVEKATGKKDLRPLMSYCQAR